jgi:peptidoglycan L-alanyl-D-glutamate endopeptidase CwlK
MTARKFSQRSLDSMKGIHPDLRKVMDRALQTSPLDFIVIEGLRTKDRQAKLVASGASKTMNSRHLTGHAVDLLPIGYDGKAAFDWPLYHKLAPAVKQAAKDLGVALVWGGDWKSFKDGPHFELDRKVYPADAPFPAAPVAPVPPAAPSPTPTNPNGLWASIIAALTRLFGRN